jgi:serine/threonine protein kinase
VIGIPRQGETGIETHRLIGGRYRLGDVLGRTLMSEVRSGEDLRLRRAVAVKLLRDDGSARSIERFEQEAQILARLHHPNVVTVFDMGIDDAERFIVMEFVEGPTLRELLDNEGPLEVERATEITGGLASALAYAHGLRIVHRDVKPSNVLLPQDGVKLVDMGIARLLSPQALTLTLRGLGTARYMSPEQARGEPLDGRSDLYSLGCVLFEMLTGRPPFDGNPIALSYAHSHTPAPRVRSIQPEVPAAMDELVASMLEKDPLNRPQTGEEVSRSLAAFTAQDAIEPMASTEPVPLPLPPPPPRRPAAERRGPRSSTWRAVIIGLGSLLAVVAVIAMARAGSDGRSSGSRPSIQRSSSATTQESPPVETGSPALGQPSPQEAAAAVLDTVRVGTEAGEITRHFGDEVHHTIDEILRETDKGEDMEKPLQSVADLREKVSEALGKGEITSATRASEIDDALLKLEQAIRDAEQ